MQTQNHRRAPLAAWETKSEWAITAPPDFAFMDARIMMNEEKKKKTALTTGRKEDTDMVLMHIFLVPSLALFYSLFTMH